MPTPEPEEGDGDLLPPGSRWGAGAQSVLPYLARALQTRPIPLPEHRESRSGDAPPALAGWPPGAAG